MGEASNIYGVIMFGFLGTTLMYVFSTLLTANGSLKQMNIIAASGIVLNATLNIILVPMLMAKGSAFTNLVTQLSTGIAYLLMAQYIFRFRINYIYLGKLLLYVLLVLSAAAGSRYLTGRWEMNLLLMIAGSLILASLFKFLSIKRFITIIRTPDTLA
jgi:hypothetical protein